MLAITIESNVSSREKPEEDFLEYKLILVPQAFFEQTIILATLLSSYGKMVLKNRIYYSICHPGLWGRIQSECNERRSPAKAGAHVNKIPLANFLVPQARMTK
jgi:hypothetical protein